MRFNGFCGLQITDEGIVQLPSALPSHWKRVTVTGVGSDKKTYVRERQYDVCDGGAINQKTSYG